MCFKSWFPWRPGACLRGWVSSRKLLAPHPGSTAVCPLAMALTAGSDRLTGSFQMVFNVVYPMAPDQRRHVSINSARWLPDPGMGLAYGTNKGDLVICRPV